MLEAVSRAAAQKPHFFHPRMAIYDEVAIGSLLVLADAGLNQRGIFHRREPEGEIFAHALQRCRTDHSFAERGIEGGAARIVGYFEPAPVAAGDAVEEAVTVVAPHRKMARR